MRLLRYILIFILILILTVGGFCLWASDKYVVPIIMYHSVNSSGTFKTANIVSPATFEKQMTYLRKQGYHVLSLDELVTKIKQGDDLSRKSVVITFDDGYEDNYLYAFTILKAYQFPATIFVCSEVVGKDGYLTWEQLKEMQVFGIITSSHTRLHAYLPDLSKEKLISEVKGSKRTIENNFNKQVDYFSYPAGGFSEEIKEILKDVGYKGACTTNRGYNRYNEDVYELKRIRFSEKDKSDLVLWAKLSGYYNLFRKVKKPY